MDKIMKQGSKIAKSSKKLADSINKHEMDEKSMYKSISKKKPKKR